MHKTLFWLFCSPGIKASGHFAVKIVVKFPLTFQVYGGLLKIELLGRNGGKSVYFQIGRLWVFSGVKEPVIREIFVIKISFCL